jgi:hypothetical protein
MDTFDQEFESVTLADMRAMQEVLNAGPGKTRHIGRFGSIYGRPAAAPANGIASASDGGNCVAGTNRAGARREKAERSVSST